LFLFHESFFPNHLGLSEQKILALYGIIFTIYLIKFRQIISNVKPYLMFIVIVFFGLSVLIDEVLKNWESIWRIFLEDGFKLLGIVSWSGYLIGTCWQTIIKSLTVKQVIEP
jgi:hypothetical protein